VKTDPPNPAQKKYMEQVRALGSILTKQKPAVIHHPVGRKGKHNKISIGHWWPVPLTDGQHKELHNGEKFGFKTRKDFEKWAAWQIAMKLGKSMLPEGVYDAIQDYHK